MKGNDEASNDRKKSDITLWVGHIARKDKYRWVVEWIPGDFEMTHWKTSSVMGCVSQPFDEYDGR